MKIISIIRFDKAKNSYDIIFSTRPTTAISTTTAATTTTSTTTSTPFSMPSFFGSLLTAPLEIDDTSDLFSITENPSLDATTAPSVIHHFHHSVDENAPSMNIKEW